MEVEEYVEGLRERAQQYFREREPYVSRLQRHMNEQAAISRAEQIDYLERSLEDEERRNLRLNRELVEETTLRIRAERELREAGETIEQLEREPNAGTRKGGSRSEGSAGSKSPDKRPRKRAAKSGTDVGASGTVPGGAQPVDGGTAHESDGNPVTADKRRPAKPTGRPASGGSSRKRGNVK